MKEIMLLDGAESVFLEGANGTGILLLHGFTGNPCEMKYIGGKINAAGFTVFIPRYPGHGTSMNEMLNSAADSWYGCAREAYIELSAKCNQVYIAGLSMGGIFTSLLAAEFNPDRIALVSTPIGTGSPLIWLAPVFGLFIKVLPAQNEKYGINSPACRENHVCYREGTPVRQAWQLSKYIRRAMRVLPRIKSAALIIQSDGDEVIPRGSADYIFSRIGSREKKKFIFKKSNHVITNDYDRDDAADMLTGFFLKGL